MANPIYYFEVSGAKQAQSRVQRVRKNLLAAQKRLEAEPSKSVQKVGRMGVYFAKREAPVYTGALVNAIGLVMRQSKGVASAIVESKVPDNPRHKTPQNYHVLMHYNDSVAAGIRSGNPHYMFALGEYMRDLGLAEAKRVRGVLVSTLKGASVF